MSKRVNSDTGRRIAKGGPAGRKPGDENAIRGTTASGRLRWPPRRIPPGTSPRGRSGGTGPGKGHLPAS